MAKLVPTTPYYSLLEDILEHLFRPEIQYLEEEADVPNLVELRDVFCVGEKYYVYLTIGTKTGFIEIDPGDKFDEMVYKAANVTEKVTQSAAIAYLKSLVAAAASASSASSASASGSGS